MTSYLPFFSGTATVAGALVGLLFVALSVAPERLRGAHASVEHQAIAATAFTALVDALFVSLIGLQPGGGLAYGAVILGAVGLSSSCGLAVKLWRAVLGTARPGGWRPAGPAGQAARRARAAGPAGAAGAGAGPGRGMSKPVRAR